MLTIDGSQGEGGGQIVRSSLAMAMVTGRAVCIQNVRAGRRKPGLMRQHLTAVRAAAELCDAQVTGDAIGAMELSFTPGTVKRGGSHTFSIGTAGSATLVLQTVLPALLCAPAGIAATTLVLEGGTHNPFAPPYDFLEKAFLPLVNRMGAKVSAHLERCGFYPAGGGRFVVTVEPAEGLSPLELMERGEVVRRSARALVSSLPRAIAERELKVVQKKLNWPPEELHVEEAKECQGPGNVCMLEVQSEHVTEVFTGFGELGRAAEAVATHAVQQCQRYLAADVPVGEYLADQLMLPMAVCGSGAFRTLPLSRHATTHAALIERFCDKQVRVTSDTGRTVTVEVRGR